MNTDWPESLHEAPLWLCWLGLLVYVTIWLIPLSLVVVTLFSHPHR